MDGQGLIFFLESIRHEIPGPLQGEFEDLIQLVRNIVDALDQIIAPPEVIDDGKNQLLTHHTILTNHATTLQTNLTDFQNLSIGSGSAAYHTSASQALQQFNQLNDHLSFAINAHNSISSNLVDAQIAWEALAAILVLFITTTILLPESLPAYAAEGAGAGFSLASLGAAMTSIGTTLTSLASAALPYVAVTVTALVAASILTGDTPQSQVQPIAVSHTLPLISSKPTLPNPELTDAEKQFANDLFTEFGGAVPKETLQYLVKVLGASKLSAAMIRCLYQNGYLDLSGYMGNKGKQLVDANNNAWVNINDHLDPNDLEGVWKEANPSEVDPSTITPGSKFVSNADHKTEVNDALNSVNNLINNLKNVITIFNNKIAHAPDPKAPGVLDLIDKRTRLQKLEDAFTKLRDFVRSKTVKGSPSPDTWPDQGKLPIVEDLLQTSSCKVPDAKYYK